MNFLFSEAYLSMMSFYFVLFMIFFALPLELVAASREKSLFPKENLFPFPHKQMVNDLDFITNLFQISYAPAEWKAEQLGWNLNREILNAKMRVVQNPHLSQKEFQRILKDFCLATQDYHVIPQFYSTESSTLPFYIQSVKGKYFVSSIVPESPFSLTSCPLSVGDQILSLNGIPIEQAVEQFRLQEIGTNHPRTDRALAELYMTVRLGSSGHEVPSGSVEVACLKDGEDAPSTYFLEWDYSEQDLLQAPMPRFEKGLKKSSLVSEARNLYKKQFMTPHCRLLRRFGNEMDEPSDILGARKSMIPPLGIVLWESEEACEFYAYVFLMDDMSIGGYVRIPSYFTDSDFAAEEFAEIIELFEEVVDVLVVDQMNNGGGFVLYLYALLAMLTDYELEVPMHRIMLSHEDVYFAEKLSRQLETVKNDRSARKVLGETLEGIVVDYRLAKCLMRSNQFVTGQWNGGKLFTDYHYLYGIEKIIPHPEVNFTKPILVLTNSLDFSAADFFPAIMQDNGRAKIMGSRTAGAGGYFQQIVFPNLNGIEEINVTASIARRPNGMPIENRGVMPDIPYEITESDIKNSYCDYKENILKELKMLLPALEPVL